MDLRVVAPCLCGSEVVQWRNCPTASRDVGEEPDGTKWSSTNGLSNPRSLCPYIPSTLEKPLNALVNAGSLLLLDKSSQSASEDIGNWSSCHVEDSFEGLLGNG